MSHFEQLVLEMRTAQRSAKATRRWDQIKRAEALEAEVDTELQALRKAEAGSQPAAYNADLFGENR